MLMMLMLMMRKDESSNSAEEPQQSVRVASVTYSIGIGFPNSNPDCWAQKNNSRRETADGRQVDDS